MVSALIFAAPLSLLTTVVLRRWVRSPDERPRPPFLPAIVVSYLAWAVLIYAWIIGHGVH